MITEPLRDAVAALQHSRDRADSPDRDDPATRTELLEALAAAAEAFVDAHGDRVDQALALRRICITNRRSTVLWEPADLPAGYLLVEEAPRGAQSGIAPDGRVSS